MSEQLAAPAGHYVPVGVCGGCPWRGSCHPARQHAVELSGLGLGRHGICEYYREFERRARAVVIRPRLSDRIGSLLRAMPGGRL